MGEKQLNERALELRREYQREWRRKNKEKPTIYQYIHRGDFPSFKLGNRTLVSVAGLQEWIRKQVNEQ